VPGFHVPPLRGWIFDCVSLRSLLNTATLITQDWDRVFSLRAKARVFGAVERRGRKPRPFKAGLKVF